MNRKKIIIASPHVWNSPYKIGSHHYARCFAETGWEVAYVSTPITPFHIIYYALSSQWKNVHMPQQWRSWITGGNQINNLWTYVPFGLIPITNKIIFNSKWAINNTIKILFPPLKRKLIQKGFHNVNIIWLGSPIFGHLLDMIPYEKSILRIADELSGYPEVDKTLVQAELELAKKVDLVVVTARLLEKKMKEKGVKNILYLPNGVELHHFTKDESIEPEDLKFIPKPRVIYIGAIDRWFNEEWVYYAATRRKDISFVIIGPYKKGFFPELEGAPNVYFLGKRDYSKIPAYLKHSNIGMIPFKMLPFIDSVNPIKLYEYMASGLPVVSTKWKTLEEISSPAFLAESKDDFLRQINKVLGIHPGFKDKCVKFASENSWSRRFELVMKYIETI